MAAPDLRRVEDLARGFAEPAGLEVVVVELVQEQTGRILRVRLDKPGGIAIDDCAAVAERLSRALDHELVIEGPYSLEVSSPGIDRPLVRRADYERFTGSRAAVRLREARDGRRKFRGTLKGLEGDDVMIETEDGLFRIPLAAVAKAHLEMDVGAKE